MQRQVGGGRRPRTLAVRHVAHRVVKHKQLLERERRQQGRARDVDVPHPVEAVGDLRGVVGGRPRCRVGRHKRRVLHSVLGEDLRPHAGPTRRDKVDLSFQLCRTGVGGGVGPVNVHEVGHFGGNTQVHLVPVVTRAVGVEKLGRPGGRRALCAINGHRRAAPRHAGGPHRGIVHVPAVPRARPRGGGQSSKATDGGGRPRSALHRGSDVVAVHIKHEQFIKVNALKTGWSGRRG